MRHLTSAGNLCLAMAWAALSFMYAPTALAENYILEDFEDYTQTDLNGQGDWVADTVYEVVNDEKWDGAQGLKAYFTSDSFLDAHKHFTTSTAGTLYYSTKLNYGADGTAMNSSIYLYDEANAVAGVIINRGASSGNIYAFTNDGYDDVGDVDDDTWVRIGIQWDDAAQADKYRVNVNGGAWSDWKAYNGSPSWDGIDSIKIQGRAQDGATSGDVSWDYFSSDYELPSEESGTATTTSDTALLIGIKQSAQEIVFALAIITFFLIGWGAYRLSLAFPPYER